MKLNSSSKARQFEERYNRSINDPISFWQEQGQIIDWFQPFTKVKDVSFNEEDLHIKWYEDGVLNACHNCLDRHLEKQGETPAILWEGDEPSNQRQLSYNQLFELTCRIANVLKTHGVKKGDRVTIYMPMIPEAVASMLACARIGAIHSVVFGGFSSSSLASRIEDCESKILITADGSNRRGSPYGLKEKADIALESDHLIEKVLVVQHTKTPVNMKAGRDLWMHEELSKVSSDCPCEPMNAEDPLFILYTSGSTGKPKGVLHTTGGYMVYGALTHKVIFDYQPGDIYWCTADIGWITGHTYLVYGPLANGATCLMFEGTPDYPNYSRFWKIIDRYHVNIFYTAPTAIRALMKQGNEHVTKTSRASLKLLGSVGEPIDEGAWQWYHDVVGNARCPIVDTWWQTETGGILLSPIPHATEQIPGSVAHAFLGIQPELVDSQGNVLQGAAEGSLIFADSWPGQMRTVYKNHQRFYETYFATFPGKYFSGDGAKRDAHGNYRITGRTDDVLKVSGHRLGTAEIESALDHHEKVAESAIVGFPHEIKGEGIYAFVSLNAGQTPSEDLKKELIRHISDQIGPIAKPDHIQWVTDLPKTRSGKIMRRILRKVAQGKYDELGDTSTLANPEIVDELVQNRSELT